MHHRQVAIPKVLFEALNMGVGDYLEAEIKKGQLVYTPKSLVDRDIAEALEDIRAGRTMGPFNSADEAIKALKSAKL